MSNEAALAELQAQIDRIKSLRLIASEVAPDVADELRTEILRTANAGQAPDGTPWEKTKDGRTPLRNVAKRLNVRALGTVVLAVLTGASALHHLGRAAGGIKRQVLPSRKLPGAATEAIKRAITKRVKERLSG